MATSASYRSSSSAGSTSPNGDGSNTYRRATDLLNHVAYLSSCATSPILSPRRRSSPHSPDRGSPSAASAVVSASRNHNGNSGSNGNGSGSSRSDDNSVEACRRRNTDEVFGSSPASTHTSSSLEDLHSHQSRSANYYSFPSFDMYDDGQDKEEDIEG
ncbi:hypothetical protein SBRCBS47491_004859 [Sporothrix bragantina]|uniref:Uncharacterized protein n=1 Tax=Sporothrix bragantina TaxID=671064 RepID=A0ABP0BRS4_9PEZI